MSARSRIGRLLSLALIALLLSGAVAAHGGTFRGETAISPQPLGLGLLSVGYLGCSQTTGAAEGYHEIGGQRLWPVIDYGGGSITRWSDPASSAEYWAQFDQNMARHPAFTIWWQLCVITGNVDSNYSEAQLVLAQLRLHAPLRVIYVSAQNGYVWPHVCGIGPSNGPAIAQGVADRLVAAGSALRGPVMSALRGPGSAGPGPIETQGGCHPNALGRAKLGSNLITFFG